MSYDRIFLLESGGASAPDPLGGGLIALETSIRNCQAHFQRNVLGKTPSGCHDQMKDLLNRVIVAGSQQEAIGHFAEEGDELGEEAPNVIRALQNGLFDATVVLALPEKHHRWNRTTNMLERLIQKIRRREKVIRIFTSKESAWRPVGALLAEKKSTSTFRRTTR